MLMSTKKQEKTVQNRAACSVLHGVSQVVHKYDQSQFSLVV